MNSILIAFSVAWLVLLPNTLRRIAQRRTKRTVLDTVCYSTLALCWLLSVALPFRHQGTLNTRHDDFFFLLGIVLTWVPNLVAWWRRHRAGAA